MVDLGAAEESCNLRFLRCQFGNALEQFSVHNCFHFRNYQRCSRSRLGTPNTRTSDVVGLGACIFLCICACNLSPARNGYCRSEQVGKLAFQVAEIYGYVIKAAEQHWLDQVTELLDLLH